MYGRGLVVVGVVSWLAGSVAGPVAADPAARTRARALLEAALTDMLSGDLDKARAGLTQASQVDPTYVSPRYNLGLLAARDEDWDAAIRHFTEAQALGPSPELARRIADCLAYALGAQRDDLTADGQRRRRYTDAVAAADALLARGQYTAAIGELAAAAQLDPERWEAYARAAAAMSAAGHGEQARAFLAQALDRAPDSVKPALQQLSSDMDKGLRYAEFTLAGYEALSARDYGAAADAFAQAQAAFPERPRAELRAAAALAFAGRFDQASPMLDRLAASDDQWVAARASGLRLRLSERSPRRATESDRQNAAAHRDRGATYLREPHYDLAIPEYTRAMELDPGHAPDYANRGLAYLELGQHDLAIADYTRAVELDPKCAWAYFGRGRAYYATQQHDLAIADYTRTIELAPSDDWAYRSRGLAHEALQEHDLAIADYTKAIELNPQEAEAYHFRGLVYYGRQQYEEAIGDCTKATELNPRHAPALNNRGCAYRAMGQYAAAIADYTRAIELKPAYALAYYNRGATYHLQGDQVRARADAVRSRELGNTNDWCELYRKLGL